MEDFTGLGEWGKATGKLIDAFREGTGGALRPKQIRRVAAAEADARRILAQGDADAERISALGHQETQIELAKRHESYLATVGIKDKLDILVESELGRAFVNWAYRETRGQHNLESIVAKALLETQKIPDDQVSDKPVDEDWLYAFFKYCRDISDGDMQNLWAKVFAGETSKPGSCHIRTIMSLCSMDSLEAEIFTNHCRYLVRGGEHSRPVWILPTEVRFGWEDSRYLEHTRYLAHLTDIGLFTAEQRVFPEELIDKKIIYGPHGFCLRAEPNSRVQSCNVAMRIYPLSVVGDQLYTLACKDHSEEYYQHLINVQFPGEGFTVEIAENKSN